MKMRSTHFWNEIVLNHYTDEDYLESFRMKKSSFEILCSKLAPALKSHPTPVREPISVEKKIAVSLYKLASCCEYSGGKCFWNPQKYCSETVHFDRDDVVNFYIFNR
jgi:hypothetical protein